MYFCRESILLLLIWRIDIISGYRRNEITSLPGLSFLGPYVSDQSASVGKKLTVICKVRGEPEPEIQWLRHVGNESRSSNSIVIDGEIFQPVLKTKYFRGKKQRYVRRLVLRKPTEADSGLYACRISSNAGVIVKIYHIKFHKENLTPVRLQSTTQVSEGRVEVFYQGKWATVCHAGFQLPEATLVCRNLGYQNGGIPRFLFERSPVFQSLKKQARVLMLQMKCPLNATNVNDCVFWEADSPICENYYDSGVTCTNETMEVSSMPIRFEGDAPEEGLLEIYSEGYWGTVCSDGIGQNEVDTICRIFGYRYGGTHYVVETPVIGSRPVLMRSLKCPANAEGLNQCSYMGRPDFCLDCKCNHKHDVGIDCKRSPDEDDPGRRVRLAASRVEHQGRLEVYHNGSWGTVGHAWLGYEGANVMCKMLGYQYGGTPFFKAPPGRGIIWINYMECPLIASDLTECNVEWGKSEFLTHNGDVGVTCRTEPVEVPEVPFRLASYGKLNYFRDGYWGTVCGAYFGTPEATMVCNILGQRFGGHASLNSERWSSYRSDSPPILLSYLDCPFNVSSLDECGRRDIGLSFYRLSCGRMDHAKDVEITCRTEPFPEIPLRLTGGQSENEGVVEAYLDGDWGNLCQNHLFDPRELSVVCHQLEHSKGGEILDGSPLGFPSEFSRKFLSKLECTGKEPNVGYCNEVTRADYCGSYTIITAVKCYKDNLSNANWTVSLKTEPSTEVGLVVITRNGESWTICPLWWDEIHANATCKMLGFQGGNATYVDTGSSSSRVQMNTITKMYCERGATSLKECFLTRWGDNSCKISRYRAGVECY